MALWQVALAPNAYAAAQAATSKAVPSINDICGSLAFEIDMYEWSDYAELR